MHRKQLLRAGLTGQKFICWAVGILCGGLVIYGLWLHNLAVQNNVSPKDYAVMAQEIVEQSRQ